MHTPNLMRHWLRYGYLLLFASPDCESYTLFHGYMFGGTYYGDGAGLGYGYVDDYGKGDGYGCGDSDGDSDGNGLGQGDGVMYGDTNGDGRC